MEYLSILEKHGLSAAEAKVYFTLLQTGQTLVGPVIKKTGLHRATTYQVLERLKEKGLVSSVIKEKKQYFEPADPKCLMDLLKKKQEELDSVLGDFKQMYKEHEHKQQISVYTGVKSIHYVLEKMLDELKNGGEYFDFGVSGLLYDTVGRPWYTSVWSTRKKKFGIRSKVIFDESVKKTHKQLLSDYVGEKRFFPKQFRSMTDTMIYNDTVIMLIWTAKPPIAVLIKNKDNAQSYKNQFKMLWKIAK